jgi:hypothetical protein
MDYDNDSLHFDLSSQTKAGRQRVLVLRDFNLGRVLHDCASAVYLKFLPGALSPRLQPSVPIPASRTPGNIEALLALS